MTSFHITELKSFMGKLLGTDCFHSFLLEEATILGAVSYTIDGHMNRDFYTQEEWEDPEIRPYDFATWDSVRPICFDMIKGRKTPSAFKFVLHLMPDYVPDIVKQADSALSPEQVKALVLTIRYDGNAVTLVTGTSFHTFVLDKSLEQQWDRTMRRFLQKKEIACQEK